jgi:putative ABC transport system permease protein
MRYKGRSILSITLLGLPLLGVAIGASAFDTTSLSVEEHTAQYLGENDAFIDAAYPGQPITQYTWDSEYPWWEPEGGYDEDQEPRLLTEAEILNALPVGSWVAPFNTYNANEEAVQVETPDGLGEINTIGYDLSDPTYEAAGFEYLDGSKPIRDEVVLSEEAAQYLELGVGDTITFVNGSRTEEHEVSGIIEIPWEINGVYVIASFFPDDTNGWLVDTPEEITHEDALKLNELGLSVWATALLDTPPSAPDGQEFTDEASGFMLTIYALIVVTVVMEVILLAGPAFAISARRRTREFALMSASGATPAQIRNTVLAGGLLFGLIAALTAVALGIGLIAVGRPVLEQIVGHRTPGLRVLPWLQGVLVLVALATGLLSALAAAISASRINVVAALMGRTPGRKGSKRWLVVGLVMVGGGLAAGFAGITIWSMPLMASAIVLLQLGLVACTPALLAVTAKVGRWLPLAPRMALREAGRNRGSAAPAIAAVLGVVAAGMAFSMYSAANNVRSESFQERLLPEGTLSVGLHYNGDWDPETGEPEETVDWEAAVLEAETRIGEHLDDAQLVPVPLSESSQTCGREAGLPDDAEIYCDLSLARPEANQCSYWEEEHGTEEEERAAVEAAREDPHCDENWNEFGWGLYEIPTSTDPDVVATYTGLEGGDLDAAVAVLEEGGVLVSDRWALTDEGTVVFEQTLEVMTDEDAAAPEATVYEIEVPAMAVDEDLLGYAQVFLSPGAAEQLGMEESIWTHRYLVETSIEVDGAVSEAIAADMNNEIADGTVWAEFRMTDYTNRETLYMLLAVAGLCALITLGSTAVSTGLIIAEQRRDMTTLGAVGAAPGLRKRFAMWQTIMIALFGTVLGTIAGLLGYALIREALNRPLTNQYPYETLYGWELPWANFAIMLVAVPVIAAIGALVFTKARLQSERRLT